jgi:hypothetical protein
MPAAPAIYIKRLYKLGFGLPIWEPNPNHDDEEVNVGVVGFMDMELGGERPRMQLALNPHNVGRTDFQYLFNAQLPPPGIPALQLDPHMIRRTILDKGVYSCSAVRQTNAGVEISR